MLCLRVKVTDIPTPLRARESGKREKWSFRLRMEMELELASASDVVDLVTEPGVCPRAKGQSE
jgi:hypothetical protein